jgi:hypothetical protein
VLLNDLPGQGAYSLSVIGNAVKQSRQLGSWIAFLTMTKNRAAYYQYINEPFFFVFFPLFPGIAGVGSRNDEGEAEIFSRQRRPVRHFPLFIRGI